MLEREIVCVYVGERERERERGTLIDDRPIALINFFAIVLSVATSSTRRRVFLFL